MEINNKIMKFQNNEPNFQPNQLQPKKIQKQEKLNTNQIYDDEFVSLINGLNESIKEYYKVSRNNISEAKNLLIYYKQQQGEVLQSLMNETNQNSFDRDNERLEQIPKINEIIDQLHDQLQLNNNSNEKNLNLFFEDAKILFKKMKMKRHQKLLEIKNCNNYNSNKDTNEMNRCGQVLNDSFSNSFNVIQSKNIAKNNLINKNNMNNLKRAQSPFKKINPNMNNPNLNSSILTSINIKYSQILKLLNNFSEFNYMISKMNFEASNKYNTLQNNIKKELDILMNLVKNNILSKNKNEIIKNFNDINNDQNDNKRSQSIPSRVNKEIEKLKKLNQINEKKIIELNNQLNMYKNNMGNNNINNTNNNTLKQKDYQILNLQQQLSVYQNNENLLNTQINELNNKFKIKINQYESQISNKNKNIIKVQNENNNLKDKINQLEIQIKELSQNYNGLNMNNNMGNNNLNIDLQNQIEMLKREMQMKENEFNKEKEMFMNKNNLNDQQINTINTQNQKVIEDLKMKINQLNKEIINYQKKEKLYEENNNKYIKQIEDMNKNIEYTNKIIVQKDEIIKQLNQKKNEQISDINNSNKINLDLKKERDDYKFQFEQMQKKYINTKELLEDKNANSQPQDNNNMNNNDMLKMKLMDMQLENEKLQKEITELKKNNNNNLLLNNQIINGNNIQPNNPQINECIKKINELTLENQKIKELSSGDKEKITKLETDIVKKNEELEGLKTFIFKLQSQLEKNDDNKNRNKQKNHMNFENENLNTDPNRNKNNKNNIDHNKSFDGQKDGNTAMMKNLLNKLNDSETKITTLQNKVKELQFQLEEKQVEKEISGYRTEDINFSIYEEEFDLKKMVNGARDKNRSEDINIDYPGVQGIKDKYKELLQNMNLLEEQVKILISNINCNSKIKPQITQICQLMRIPAKNIQLIIAGKDKKKALGIIA